MTLANKQTVARILPGATFLSQPVALAIPANAPDTVYGVVEVDKIHAGLGTPEHVALDGVANRTEARLVDTTYVALVTSVSPEFSDGSEPITISGQATDRNSGLASSLAPVKICLINRGFKQTFEVIANELGQFQYVYEPNRQDGGNFDVRAAHPLLTDMAPQQSFTISRLRLSPETYDLRIPRNYTYKVKTRILATGSANAQNLTFDYLAEDQAGGQLVPGLHFDFPTVQLIEGKGADLNIMVAADNAAPATGSVLLRLKSDGVPNWGTFRLNYILSGIEPSLSAEPSHLETGLAPGETLTESVTLSNSGLDALKDVQLTLVNSDGSTAPNWVVLNPVENFTSLAVGDRREVPITFAPTTSVTLSGTTPYQFKLVVSASNASPFEVPVYCWVNQSGKGHILFKVTDMYTGTLDTNTNNPIEGKAGAKIRLIKEEGSPHEASASTDSLGEAYLRNLPAGRYAVRVSADKRVTYQGRVWVRPGATASEQVHLDADLITVDWEVTETTIQDEYEVILNARFETDVPAAVLVAEPAGISLPKMSVGDAYYGEFTLTNYGLIKASNITYKIISTPGLGIELLYDIPKTMAAGEVVRIPYRVIKKPRPNQKSDCIFESSSLPIAFDYECKNGKISASRTSFGAGLPSLGCIPSIGSDGPKGTWAGGGSGGGGGAGGYSGRAFMFPLSKICAPECEDRTKKCCHKEETCSSVYLLSGKYADEVVDLQVKVLGARLEVLREYDGDKWLISSFFGRSIKFSYDNKNVINGMELMGILYKRVGNSTELFANADGSRISKSGQTWKWYGRKNNYETYDESGRFMGYGNERGVGVHFQYDAAGRLTQILDHHSVTALSFQYNAQDRITQVTDRVGRKVQYGYDAVGNLSTVIDLRGGTMSYQYDNKNRITQKTWPNGKKATITYNEFNMVESVVDNAGEGKFFEYGYDNRTKEYITTVRNSLGSITEYWLKSPSKITREAQNGEIVIKQPKSVVHDDNHRVVMTIDGSGGQTTYTYNGNQVTSETLPTGLVHEYVYDQAGNRVLERRNAGTSDEIEIHYTYDAYGQIVGERMMASSNTPEQVRTYVYDAYGNKTVTTDSFGKQVTATFDVMGNTLSLTNREGEVTSRKYNNAGDLTEEINAAGEKTQYIRDVMGNAVEIIKPSNERDKFTYDLDNRVIKQVNARGEMTEATYSAGVVTLTNPIGRATTYSFDNRGRLDHVLDSGLGITEFEYDPLLGRKIILDYGENVIEHNYSGEGNIEKVSNVIGNEAPLSVTTEKRDKGLATIVRDPLNRTTTLSMNKTQMKHSLTDPLGNQTQYDFNAHGSIVKITDAMGDLSHMTYDAENRLTSLEVDDQNYTYTYTDEGQISSRTDKTGRKTNYEYDQLHRLTEVKVYPPGSTTAESTSYFTFDSDGYLVSSGNDEVASTYNYNHVTHELTVTTQYIEAGFSKSYTIVYDELNRYKHFLDPNGRQYTYSYNAAGFVEAMTLPGEGQITYSEFNAVVPEKVSEGHNNPLVTTVINAYQKARRFPLSSRITYPGGVEQAKTFKGELTLTDQVTSNGDTLYSCTNTWNQGSQLDQVLINGQATQFTYDPSGQLRTSSEGANTTNWNYDSAGNRVTENDKLMTYNPNRQLVQAGGITYTYDALGNLASKTESGDTTMYEYDSNNFLKKVHKNGILIASYRYNENGLRIAKTVGGQTTWYLYGERGLIGEYDQSGQELRTYGYGPGSTWMGPIFLQQNESYYYYIYDSQNNPNRLITSAGIVAWSADAGAFGDLSVNSNSTVENHIRFSSQYFDAETGLHYNTFRYYDPQIGRYTTIDPLWDLGVMTVLVGKTEPAFKLNSERSFLLGNRYAFASNDPVTGGDYYGLCPHSTPSLGLGLDYTSRFWGAGVEVSSCCRDGDLQTTISARFCVGINSGKPAWGGQAGIDVPLTNCGPPGPKIVLDGGKGPFSLNRPIWPPGEFTNPQNPAGLGLGVNPDDYKDPNDWHPKLMICTAIPIHTFTDKCACDF